MDRALGIERRTELRCAPPRGARFGTLRPGYPVTLVNVSAAGALVLTRRPMHPGSRVHLQVVAASARLAISALVVRCAVTALDPIEGVVYGGGLQFDHQVEWCW